MTDFVVITGLSGAGRSTAADVLEDQGWFVIDKVSSRSEYLRHDGVPRVLSFDLSLKRSDAPSAGSYFSIISGLFG